MAGVKVISELVSGNEYRGSWGDPRKIVAVAKNDPDKDRENQVQTTQTTLETIADTARTVGRTGVETIAEPPPLWADCSTLPPAAPLKNPKTTRSVAG